MIKYSLFKIFFLQMLLFPPVLAFSQKEDNVVQNHPPVPTVMEKAYAQGITSINISSTTNHPSNAKRSAHTVGRAFDINVINGIHVSTKNPYVDVMQNIILNTPGWMEDTALL